MENKNIKIIFENLDIKPEGLKSLENVQKRKPGSAKGMLTITDDFHQPLHEEEIKDFYKGV